MAMVPPIARPVMLNVQRARGRALTLRKAWRAVHRDVRRLENGITRPTEERGERQVEQTKSVGLATMQPHAPQRGSFSGPETGFDPVAPISAMIKKMSTSNPAKAIRIKGRDNCREVGIAESFVGSNEV